MNDFIKMMFFLSVWVVFMLFADAVIGFINRATEAIEVPIACVEMPVDTVTHKTKYPKQSDRVPPRWKP